MLENAEEYWAEGCQSWFDATVSDKLQKDCTARASTTARLALTAWIRC
jgi:hypothetical protein